MTNEQEIFALMQMAKDQQTAVEQAVAGLDERRRELGAVITQMRTLEASVAEEAKIRAASTGTTRTAVEHRLRRPVLYRTGLHEHGMNSF